MKSILPILFTLGSFLLCPFLMEAQVLPSGSSDAWRRNANNTAGGTGNLFGTRSWNSPVYFNTALPTGGLWTGIRMKLNGEFSAGNQYQISGYSAGDGVNTSGYLGLGQNKGQIWTNNDLDGSPSRGPFSLLHLNGRDGAFVQNAGYRPWMKTGISFTDNQDFSYIGLRKVGAGDDVTETTIAWADNAGNAYGPDELAFRFTTNSNSNTISGDLNASNDLDGKMIAQFRGNGNMGLGQIFTPGAAGQKAQSRLHIAKTAIGSGVLNPNPNEVWSQITHNITNHTSNDGLRLGITTNPGTGLSTGVLRWQENSPFIIQSDWNTSPGSTSNGERMRISSINAPGVTNPGFSSNTTRVSIPIFGNIPVDQPRSLLHLGFDIGDASGIRPWMNLGTTTAGFGTLTYLGMKEEGVSPEPVLAWGDFNNTGLPIVYTSDVTGNGNALEGLEVARFSSAATAFGGDGGLGVGDFTAGVPTHKLHVRGNARFENVPDKINANYIILGEEQEGPDDMELQKLAFSGSATDVLLGNGTWGEGGAGTDDQTIEVFEFDCDTKLLTLQLENGGPAVTTDLSCIETVGGEDADWYVSGTTLAPTDIADDIYTEGLVGINTDITPLAQLEIKGDNSNDPLWVNGTHAQFRIKEQGNFGMGAPAVVGGHMLNMRDPMLDVPNASHAVNMEFSNSAGDGISLRHGSTGINSNGISTRIFGAGQVTGVYSEAINNAGTISNRGVYAVAANAGESNIALFGEIPNTMTTAPSAATNGLNVVNAANLGFEHYGVKAVTKSQTNASTQYGVYGEVVVNSTSTPATCYGGYFKSKSGGMNYGIWAEANGAGDIAAYIAGPGVYASTWEPSDQQLKKNVRDLSNASDLLQQLAPKSYNFKTEEYPQIGLSEAKQFGLISQELELVLPELVKEVHHPVQKDENGRVTHEAVDFKAVNYSALIPILVQGHKEQQAEIKELQNTIDQMDDRLHKLEALLTTTSTKEVQQASQEVELENSLRIVLDQNVPNPFAEETNIGYDLPSTFEKAQIHFFDQSGKIIKSLDLLTTGKGSVKVFGSRLSQGIYTYSLVVDGQVIDSKKMLKARD